MTGEGRLLDWSHNRVGSRAARCITCNQWALMRNDRGEPQHKVCAEAELNDRPTVEDGGMFR